MGAGDTGATGFEAAYTCSDTAAAPVRWAAKLPATSAAEPLQLKSTSGRLLVQLDPPVAPLSTSKQGIECPSEYLSVGERGADIPGCGLEECVEHVRGAEWD